MLETYMRKSLGQEFGFHEENKLCNCSIEFACYLPFPLGELSGHYVGNGLDEMVAHALKVVNAMIMKDRNNDLDELLVCLMEFRVIHWFLILESGVSSIQNDKDTKEQVLPLLEKIQARYGGDNSWFKALLFSVNMVVEMNTQLGSKFIDISSIFDDPKISNNLKQAVNFHVSELKNQEAVTRNNSWFKLWPVKVGGRLTLLLPEGTLCQNCNSLVNGRFFVMNLKHIIAHASLPVLIPRVREDGRLMIACSSGTCLRETLMKDELCTVRVNKEIFKTLVDDSKIFFSKSRICDFCLKWSYSSHRCLGCKASQYCSTQCQREDMSFHKTVCSTWAKEQERKIAGAKQQKKINKSNVAKYYEKC